MFAMSACYTRLVFTSSQNCRSFIEMLRMTWNMVCERSTRKRDEMISLGYFNPFMGTKIAKTSSIRAPWCPAKIGVCETSFHYAIACLDPGWAAELGIAIPPDPRAKTSLIHCSSSWVHSELWISQNWPVHHHHKPSSPPHSALLMTNTQ